MMQNHQLPDQQLQTIDFKDVFNIEDIQRLQDLFSDATGVASIITYPDGRPITSPSNFCHLCQNIIRKTKKGKLNCFKSDAELGRYNPGGPHVQPCLSGGLWDAGASITFGSFHIANWLIGQVRSPELDEERMIAYADEIGADKTEFMRALNEVPQMSQEQFKKIADMLFEFANELSSNTFHNYELKKQISETEELLAKLKRSEESLADIFNSVSEGIAHTTLSGKVISVNDSLVKITGIPKGKLIGKNILKIGASVLSPENAPYVVRLLSQLIRGVKIDPFRVSYKGKILEVSATRNEESGKLTGVIRDITENQKTTDAMLEMQQRNMALLRANPDMMFVFDKNGYFLDFSSGVNALTLLPPEQFIGKNISDVLPEQITILTKNMLNKVFSTGEMQTYEYQLTLNNEVHYFESRLTLCGKSQALSIVRDITEKKIADTLIQAKNMEIQSHIREYEHINLELKQRNEELKIAKEKAEESDRLKTAFLQNLSHEIRTPLNAIMGFSGLLAENYNNKPKLERYAEIIGTRSNDLLDLINDILNIAKIESGQLTINPELFDLGDFFEELRTFFSEHKKRMNKDHIQLLFVNNHHHSNILTDKVKLRQVFINLIGNALKFTHSGFVEFGYEAADKGKIMFYVKDSGIGIPGSKQTLVFNRFAQLNQETDKATSGTGLGLSIVKGLTELLGGSISLESEPGKGSNFQFTIPFHNSERP